MSAIQSPDRKETIDKLVNIYEGANEPDRLWMLRQLDEMELSRNRLESQVRGQRETVQ